MIENIFMTIVNGLKNLKKHPVLFAPAVLYYLSFIFLLILFSILLTLDLKNQWGYQLFTLLSVAYLFLILLLSSFAAAGSIGMAKEVVETDGTKLSHMLRFGKKYTLRLAAASVFIHLLRSISALFWTPVLQIFGNPEYGTDYVTDALTNDPSLLIPMIQELAAPVLFATLISAVYLLIVSFMFYFVSYIIVIDDAKVFKSYRKSFRLLRTHPIRIVSFVLLITIIEVLISFIGILAAAAANYYALPLYFGASVHLILFLFLTAAANIWTARFYIVLSEGVTAPVD
ncbi:hypothetical protein MmiAt1_05410 [Methanimicrococcus sp. At1]|uniref:DUF7847 domain-containing protein n=1 Tax=Methanimicrococcus hacksteinii TaxID=3028293 RepID=A0ABU3VNK9_9EURY|nr:hypothetical protein [Methanimicrococcus sp. At1]MDV0444989.1 hypothetical protein [Methanimicrococcus sp. At1]